ncbi:hypothetical protein [Tropicimonas isoalkanivorans]|uniref:PH domain-containing protein n=1 Tax=Tropicimonas isoalkanivorans TaxID=441112 RepID=A0A1I1N7F5_9RHOB|nr:hypothetical protein [Tropicimonas isoalkanivorans]SFC93132.1 hypothetical protein SAMN04488094_111156 [Tropicimonas isoalkanivorans]
MSFIRPELARTFLRWREVLAGLAASVAGLWLAGLGGPAMLVLGGLVTAASLALSVLAWRRMRFRVEVEAPGVVEIDEGRISYFGPLMGGAVDLSELVEIEVIDVAGRRRCWRLRQADAQTLLVPMAAAGAERLYDHFAILPGMDSSALLGALSGNATTARRIWARRGTQRHLLTD